MWGIKVSHPCNRLMRAIALYITSLKDCQLLCWFSTWACWHPRAWLALHILALISLSGEPSLPKAYHPQLYSLSWYQRGQQVAFLRLKARSTEDSIHSRISSAECMSWTSHCKDDINALATTKPMLYLKQFLLLLFLFLFSSKMLFRWFQDQAKIF